MPYLQRKASGSVRLPLQPLDQLPHQDAWKEANGQRPQFVFEPGDDDDLAPAEAAVPGLSHGSRIHGSQLEEQGVLHAGGGFES